MQNYQYNVVHRKGKDNTNADALSRIEYPTTRGDRDSDNEDLVPRHADVFATTTTGGTPQREWLQYTFVYNYDDDNDDDVCGVDVSVNDSTSQYVTPVNKIDIAKLQQDCPEIGPFYRYHKSQVLPEDINVAWRIVISADQYGLANNILYHFYQPRTRHAYKATKSVAQIVIPKQLRYNVLSDYDDSIVGGGHSGFDRTREAILQKYY